MNVRRRFRELLHVVASWQLGVEMDENLRERESGGGKGERKKESD